MKWETLGFVPFHASCGYFVFHICYWWCFQYVYWTCNNFNPKLIGQILGFNHTSCHVHDGLILSFSLSILLWIIPNCKLHVDTSLSIKICNLFWVIYLKPPSDLRTLMYLPLYFSTKALNSTSFEKVSYFFFRKYTHIFLLK